MDSSPTIDLIGAPIEIGTSEPGAVMGPAALRTAGLTRVLHDLGFTVRDRGDLAPDCAVGQRDLPAIRAWMTEISRAVEMALDGGSLPLVAGGDHSLSLGSVDGVLRHCTRSGRPLFVLWLDAHADFNTLETSPSGNVHGMPLAALCGEPGFDALFEGGERPLLDPRRVHLFGLRSIDTGERALVTQRQVNIVDMRTIDEFGVVAPCGASSTGWRPRTATCMRASTWTSSTPPSHRASAPRCRAGRRFARRISSWRCCAIRGWSAPSTWWS